MANPSSSRHDHDDRERERRHRSDRHSSSHHHHRTISSTTLLLVLSLILAVLAVMLSLPSNITARPVESKDDPAAQGMWGVLTPKRSQALVARESAVAAREAEVARREAELLVGAPGGVIPSQTVCPPCPTQEPQAPQTIIKEVVQESALAVPNWFKEAGARAEEILDRELKVAEREREISRREESVNRREHDASRRESWIMEQLIALGNDNPQTVEEEYTYEPAGARRKLPPKQQQQQQQPYYPPQQQQYYPPPPPPEREHPLYVAETAYEVETHTVTETLPPSTVTVPAPANTRLAAKPKPEGALSSPSTHSPRTTSIDVLVEEPTAEPVPPVYRTTERRPPVGWFGGW